MLTSARSGAVPVPAARNAPPASISTSPPVLPRALIETTSTSFCPVILLEPALPNSELELITPVTIRPGAAIEISPPRMEPKASMLPVSTEPALRMLISRRPGSRSRRNRTSSHIALIANDVNPRFRGNVPNIHSTADQIDRGVISSDDRTRSRIAPVPLGDRIVVGS